MPEGNGDGVRRHFSYANVMSTLAVFMVVAGGTAVAATINSSRDIAPQSVKNSDIKRQTIKSNRLKDGRAVKEVDIVPESLTGVSIADGGVGSGEIADGDVGNDDLRNGSITSAKISGNAVGGPELADVQHRTSAPVTVLGGTDFNGFIVDESATASCLAGEDLIGWNYRWTTYGGGEEVYLVHVLPNFATNEVTITAGHDEATNETFVAEAWCL